MTSVDAKPAREFSTEPQQPSRSSSPSSRHSQSIKPIISSMTEPTMDVSFVPYRLAAAYLSQRLEGVGMPRPRVGIICGSGLSGLSSAMDNQDASCSSATKNTTTTLTVKYSEIPGFPAHCTVAGHKGEVVFGTLSGVPTICFRGRFHSYEGHDMKTVVLPVYVMRCLSVVVCIITNAAGGLNPDYNVGDVVCISDHLAIPQLAGKNPLIGKNDDELGPRFPATSDAYDNEVRAAAKHAADELGIQFLIPHGVYCFVSGPMYESKAECRFLRSLGGDAVGMSTIPEVVSAHHCNMKTLCLSLITNKVIMTGDEGAPVASHAEVLEAVEQRSVEMQILVKQIVATLRNQVLPKLPPLRQVSLVLTDDAKESYREQQRRAQLMPCVPETSNSSLAASAITIAEKILVGATLVALGAWIGGRMRKS